MIESDFYKLTINQIIFYSGIEMRILLLKVSGGSKLIELVPIEGQKAISGIFCFTNIKEMLDFEKPLMQYHCVCYRHRFIATTGKPSFTHGTNTPTEFKEKCGPHSKRYTKYLGSELITEKVFTL